MPTLEPAQALYACENALRQLFTHAFQEAFGVDWLEAVSTAEQRAKWIERAEAEKRRALIGGLVAVDDLGLSFSEFYELLAMAGDHWELLAPALGKKKSTLPLLGRFEELRNTVAHQRQLYPFERDLYSGIAGTIRNQVTIYISTKDPAGEYYPRIDAAWDSMANRIVGSLDVGELAGMVDSDVVLRPGDTVTFTLVATDPQARNVEWDMAVQGLELVKQVVASGAEAVFTWTVTDESVAEHSAVHFYMRCTESQYHRVSGSYDQRVYFAYVVRPPLNGASDSGPSPAD